MRDALSAGLWKTADTLTDAAAVRATIAEVRARGWSINPGGLSAGITAVGAPIVDRSGHPIGAISVSGPSIRMTSDRFDDLGGRVAAAATRIGLTL